MDKSSHVSGFLGAIIADARRPLGHSQRQVMPVMISETAHGGMELGAAPMHDMAAAVINPPRSSTAQNNAVNTPPANHSAVELSLNPEKTVPKRPETTARDIEVDTDKTGKAVSAIEVPLAKPETPVRAPVKASDPQRSAAILEDEGVLAVLETLRQHAANLPSFSIKAAKVNAMDGQIENTIDNNALHQNHQADKTRLKTSKQASIIDAIEPEIKENSVSESTTLEPTQKSKPLENTVRASVQSKNVLERSASVAPQDMRPRSERKRKVRAPSVHIGKIDVTVLTVPPAAMPMPEAPRQPRAIPSPTPAPRAGNLNYLKRY